MPPLSNTHTHSTTSSTLSTPAQSQLGHARGFASTHLVGHVLTPHLHHHHHAPLQVSPSSSQGSSSVNASLNSSPSPVFLTREIVEAIEAAYDNKVRVVEGRVGGRTRKVLREKLRAGVESDLDPVNGGFEWDRGAPSGGEGGDRGGERDSEREKESLGAMGTTVSAGGGQILSGIGSFASGLGLGVGGGGANTCAATLLEGTLDIAWFARTVTGREKRGKARRVIKGNHRKGESDILGAGYAYAYGGKDREKDAGVGVSAMSLWAGGVLMLVKLREWEADRERMGAVVTVLDRKRERERTGLVKGKDRMALSDGDADDPSSMIAKSETDEESDVTGATGSFGAMWGERMQKVKSWTG